jgi:hypothetical protein
MDLNSTRKLVTKEFKDRTPVRGAFAIRCTDSGRVWVGTSSNLPATRNGAWFVLRNGTHRDKALQTEWNTYGEEAFQYEILETLEADVSPLLIGDLLKQKKQHWATELSAPTLLP